MPDYERLKDLRDAAERALDAYLDYAKAMVDVADRRRVDAEDELDRVKEEISHANKATA